jgi:hypothetical protein
MLSYEGVRFNGYYLFQVIGTAIEPPLPTIRLLMASGCVGALACQRTGVSPTDLSRYTPGPLSRARLSGRGDQ